MLCKSTKSSAPNVLTTDNLLRRLKFLDNYQNHKIQRRKNNERCRQALTVRYLHRYQHHLLATE
jgi:hypothetical protein